MLMAGTLPTAVEETERMKALKKAYAEMILNTAKEAAARIMAAERKAKKFEHDLISTKEEALRMLLRLKQMIEDKNAEAEVGSLNQQRRIQELELQLDEAEGLILDLREKLDKVQEQLDDAKNMPLQSLRPNEKLDMSSCHISLSELQSKSVTSEVHTSSWDPSTNVHKCLSPLTETAILSSEFDNGLVDNPVFSHTVLEKKEPELHGNVCTQRIHAIEKGLVDEKMNQVDDSHSLGKSISIIQQNGGSRITPTRTDKLNGLENVVKDASFLEDNATKDQTVKVPKLHRRKTQYGKTKATRCRYISGQCVKPQRASSAIAQCKSYSVSSKDVDRSGNNFSKTKNNTGAENGSELEGKAQLGKYQSVSVVRRSVRKRKVKYWDDFATPEVELENEFLKVPLEKRDTKASELTNKAPSLPDSGNPLQYAFSRKRKKGSLVNHDEGYSLRESSVKKRSAERKELVAKNGTVGDESTSDGRGMVKVARQLISLSGKRWW